MSEPPKFTPRQLVECAEREVRFRKRVYPRLVAEKKMAQAKANLEIAMMTEIIATLARFRDYAEKKGTS